MFAPMTSATRDLKNGSRWAGVLIGQARDIPCPFVAVKAASGKSTGVLERVTAEVVQRSEVPQNHLATGAAGGQGPPVWGERDRVHRAGVTGQPGQEAGVASIGHIPYPHRIVGAAGGQGPPVWGERHR